MLHVTQMPWCRSFEKIMVALAALVALIVVLPLRAKAQEPTQWAKEVTNLKSRSITGHADYANDCAKWARTFYYAFTAGPGRFEAQFTPGRPEGGWFEHRFGNNDICYNVSFTETAQGSGGRHGVLRLPSIGLIAPAAQRKLHTPQTWTQSKSYSLPNRTTLLMIVKLSGKFDYQIKLNGAIEIPEGPSPVNPR